jgi:lysyl-tRNA synthetase class 2
MLSPSGLQRRSRFLQAVRNFFLSRGYLEVDTPVLLPVLIPEAEIHPVRCDGGFLQTSPELCMKRLLAFGHQRLFQICPCFRRNERGRLHGEEFTMLEWYRVGWSYRELMEECEQMVCSVLREWSGNGTTGSITWGDSTVCMQRPWDRLSVDEAFCRFAGCSADSAVQNGSFDELLVTRVEPELGRKRPVFLYNYPVSLASLARAGADDPTVAERFELYIAGVELANGFSELTDQEQQRQRFALEIRQAGQNGINHQMPEKFLHSLDALPDCAGIAFGLDRMLMLLVGAQSIAAVRPLAPDDL